MSKEKPNRIFSFNLETDWRAPEFKVFATFYNVMTDSSYTIEELAENSNVVEAFELMNRCLNRNEEWLMSQLKRFEINKR